MKIIHGSISLYISIGMDSLLLAHMTIAIIMMLLTGIRLFTMMNISFIYVSRSITLAVKYIKMHRLMSLKASSTIRFIQAGTISNTMLYCIGWMQPIRIRIMG